MNSDINEVRLCGAIDQVKQITTRTGAAMAEVMAVLDGASREVLIESLISASGTLYSLMNGEPGTGQEVELFAVQMAAQFARDNRAAAVEAEAISTLDSARATIH